MDSAGEEERSAAFGRYSHYKSHCDRAMKDGDNDNLERERERERETRAAINNEIS